jgi:hypothetical protein
MEVSGNALCEMKTAGSDAMNKLNSATARTEQNKSCKTASSSEKKSGLQ